MSLLRRYGAPEIIDAVLAARDGSRSPTGFPDAWLDNDTDLVLGGRTLRVMQTPGRTRGHAVFVDSVEGLIFGADHILPHITPSIGFEPASAPLPLGDSSSPYGEYGKSRMPGRFLRTVRQPTACTSASMAPVTHHHQRLKVSATCVSGAAGTAAEVT